MVNASGLYPEKSWFESKGEYLTLQKGKCYMRDPNRIDEFCQELAAIWKENVPDWRFGQLICNVFGSMKIDPFFPEEDKMLEVFKEYFKNGE